jgi:hypothetical protein
MSSDPSDSVVLISSSDSNNTSFGTGFIIHQDNKASYVLTCDHVIRDVGGEDKALINKHKAEEVFSGEKYEIDLAVVRIQGLSDKNALKLRPCGEKGLSVLTVGFQRFNKDFLIRPLDGKLGNRIETQKKDGTKLIAGWDLLIEDYPLQHGYSGSPVVEKTKGYVVGIASHLLDGGEKGIAISIEMLRKIWPEMPHNLLRSINQAEVHKEKDIVVQINKIEKCFVNANYRQAYEDFHLLCRAYPEFENSAQLILTRYNDLLQNIEMGLIDPSAQNIHKQQIAHSFQTCMNRFKKDH